MSELVDAADAELTEDKVTEKDRDWSIRLLNVATRVVNKGEDDLPPTAGGEPNSEERLRLLKSMTLVDRLEWRSNDELAPVLLARRRASELLALNYRDHVAAEAFDVLDEVAKRILLRSK